MQIHFTDGQLKPINLRLTSTITGKRIYASRSLLCVFASSSNRRSNAGGKMLTEERGDAKLHRLSPQLHRPPLLPCARAAAAPMRARRRRFASPVTLWPVRMERRGPRRRGRLVAAAAPPRTSTSAPAQSSAATPLPVPASASTAPPRSAQAAPAPARGGRSARRARSRPPLAGPRAGRGRRRSGVELRGAGQPRTHLWSS